MTKINNNEWFKSGLSDYPEAICLTFGKKYILVLSTERFDINNDEIKARFNSEASNADDRTTRSFVTAKKSDIIDLIAGFSKVNSYADIENAKEQSEKLDTENAIESTTNSNGSAVDNNEIPAIDDDILGSDDILKFIARLEKEISEHDQDSNESQILCRVADEISDNEHTEILIPFLNSVYEYDGGMSFDADFSALTSENLIELKNTILIGCILKYTDRLAKTLETLKKAVEKSDCTPITKTKYDALVKIKPLYDTLAKNIRECLPNTAVKSESQHKIISLVYADLFKFYPVAFTFSTEDQKAESKGKKGKKDKKAVESILDESVTKPIDILCSAIAAYAKNTVISNDAKALKAMREGVKHKLYNFMRDYFNNSDAEYSVKVNNGIVNYIVNTSLRYNRNSIGTKTLTTINIKAIRKAIIETFVWYGNGCNTTDALDK